MENAVRILHVHFALCFFFIGASIEQGSSTPLMEAAQEGHVDLVKFLLEQGTMIMQIQPTDLNDMETAVINIFWSIYWLMDSGTLFRLTN